MNCCLESWVAWGGLGNTWFFCPTSPPWFFVVCIVDIQATATYCSAIQQVQHQGKNRRVFYLALEERIVQVDGYLSMVTARQPSWRWSVEAVEFILYVDLVANPRRLYCADRSYHLLPQKSSDQQATQTTCYIRKQSASSSPYKRASTLISKQQHFSSSDACCLQRDPQKGEKFFRCQEQDYITQSSRELSFTKAKPIQSFRRRHGFHSPEIPHRHGWSHDTSSNKRRIQWDIIGYPSS